MSYKCNEETLGFLEKLNKYFKAMTEDYGYQFAALPISSEHNEVDDKIEFTFHKYIDVNAKFNTKVEEDLNKIKEIVNNSEYNNAIYSASVYGENHRHFSFMILNPFVK